jgi:hypothetical protein
MKQEGGKEWALEVYKGQTTVEEAEIEGGILELALDEEEAMETSRCLGIAVFYSWKSFNPKVLFSDMLQV